MSPLPLPVRAIYFKARRFLLWTGSLKGNYQVLFKPVLHLCYCFISSNLKCWGWNVFWCHASRKVKPSFNPWAPLVMTLYLRIVFCGQEHFFMLLWQTWRELKSDACLPGGWHRARRTFVFAGPGSMCRGSMLVEVSGVQRVGLWPFSPCPVFGEGCGLQCCPLVWVVASRGALFAFTEVFPDSELQAGNSAFMH